MAQEEDPFQRYIIERPREEIRNEQASEFIIASLLAALNFVINGW